MKKSGIAILCVSMLLFACSKEDGAQETRSEPTKDQAGILEKASSEVDSGISTAKESATVITENAQEKMANMAESAEKTGESSAEKARQVADEAKAVLDEATRQATAALSEPDRESSLDLAKRSGCLSCHSIEKKVVGPAWRDVAKRYKGQEGARDQLIAKVKKGGGGNWTEITGGFPMPPNSPRVPDQYIETLVDFVLSLE